MLLHVVIQLSQHRLLKRDYPCSPSSLHALKYRLIGVWVYFWAFSSIPSTCIYPLPVPVSGLLLLCSKLLLL